MATNKRTEKAHKCGECKLGVLIKEHWNRALDGHYIAFRCPHSKWARLAENKACENIVLRNGNDKI